MSRLWRVRVIGLSTSLWDSWNQVRQLIVDLRNKKTGKRCVSRLFYSLIMRFQRLNRLDHSPDLKHGVVIWMDLITVHLLLPGSMKRGKMLSDIEAITMAATLQELIQWDKAGTTSRATSNRFWARVGGEDVVVPDSNAHSINSTQVDSMVILVLAIMGDLGEVGTSTGVMRQTRDQIGRSSTTTMLITTQWLKSRPKHTIWDKHGRQWLKAFKTSIKCTSNLMKTNGEFWWERV